MNIPGVHISSNLYQPYLSSVEFQNQPARQETAPSLWQNVKQRLECLTGCAAAADEVHYYENQTEDEQDMDNT
jgi:hypothetical protein